MKANVLLFAACCVWFMILPFELFLILSLVAWLVTLACIFGLVFFLPMVLLLAAITFISIVLIRATRKYIVQPVWEKALGLVPDCVTVTDEMKNTALMTWWMHLSGFDGDGAVLQLVLFIALTLALLSPCICYGNMLAWHVYAHHTPEENMKLVRLLYRHHFAAFSDFQFKIASLADIWQYLRACNVECYGQWMQEALSFIARLGRLLDFEPLYYLEGSTALMALNFALNLVKPVVPFINGAIIFCNPPKDSKMFGNCSIFVLCNSTKFGTMENMVEDGQARKLKFCGNGAEGKEEENKV